MNHRRALWLESKDWAGSMRTEGEFSTLERVMNKGGKDSSWDPNGGSRLSPLPSS